MKYLIIILFFNLALTNIYSQTLNKFGHISALEETQFFLSQKNIQHRDYFQINSDLLIEGNSVFKINGGYLTTVSTYENMPTSLYVYNLYGKRLFSIDEIQVVNLKLSPNKKYAAYFCNGYVKVINLSDYSIRQFKSVSTHFNLDDLGEAIVEQSLSLIVYKGNKFEIGDNLNDVIIMGEKIYLSTRYAIFSIDHHGELKQEIKLNDGVVFEMKAIKDSLYFVMRLRQNNSFLFDLYLLTADTTHTLLKRISLNVNSVSDTKLNLNETSFSQHDSIPWVYHSSGSNGFPVGNSYGEIQDYGGNPYLHPGVDMLGSPNQDVFAVRGGVVKAILTTGGAIYWRMAIAYKNESIETPGYLYAHLDQPSIPFIEGDTVYQDDFIGKVVPWPVNGFDHIHFSRIKDEGQTWTGSWWTFNNVLTDITNQIDTTKPVFQECKPGEKFSFRDLNGNYQDPSNLHDSVRILSKFYDRINSSWDVDVCNIRYSLINASNQQMILDTASYNFDFPIDTYFSNSYTYNVLYTIYNRDSSFECHSVGNYNTRDFYHIITNSYGNDTIKSSDRMHLFNTSLYSDGNYYFKITVSDCNGNNASDSMLISIQNLTSPTKINVFEKLEIYPVPAKESLTIKLNGLTNVTYTIVNSLGQFIQKGLLKDDLANIDLRNLGLSKGIYALKLQYAGNAVNFKFLVE
jgi:murein DD-endopeptidase MepM/ murein hydrolase activator NlpD